VIPSDPYETKGLLHSALQEDDPVIFLEPKRIYRASKAEVPEEKYLIPLGKARIAREGSDLTLIGYGAQHHENMKAAEQASHEGIDVEVLDLRTLNPVDVEAIENSVKKTGRCVVAHEAPLTMGYGAELSAMIMERCFLHLEAPVYRCAGFDTPFSNAHEHDYMPNSPRVLKGIRDTVDY
jgi:2-oxoisovalerate dehydrogenase E1 component beta subunit